MSIIKRLCMFIFGVAGLLFLAALFLPLWQPAEVWASVILSMPVMLTVIQVCLLITAVGFVFCLLRAICTPRNKRSVIVSSIGGDQIQVTRDAIRAQAIHLIERSGHLTARSVNVKAQKRGHIHVFVRVQPDLPQNIVDVGRRLHDELREGLANICGDTIEEVSIEFLDPVSHNESKTFSQPKAGYSPSVPTFAMSEQEVTTQDTNLPEDITVPMGPASAWRAQAPDIAQEPDIAREVGLTPDIAQEPDTAREVGLTPDIAQEPDTAREVAADSVPIAQEPFISREEHVEEQPSGPSDGGI